MANKFRFTNEVCPVCNTTFKEDDDIAVCPECGTPHHRKCFKENTKCANHEKHSEAFRWEADILNQDTIDLPKIEIEKPFNPSPEQLPFFPIAIDNDPALFNGQYTDFNEEVSLSDAVLFVRQETRKYIPKFHKIKNGKIAWNWAAFFFAPYWFFYRKMHKLGTIFLALTLLISIGFSMVPSVQKLYTDMSEWAEKYSVEDINELSEAEILKANDERIAFMSKNKTGVILVFTQTALTLALNVLIGIMANKWYYEHTLKTIKKINTEEKDKQNRTILFLRQGGTSAGSFFLAVLANNMVVMAAEMLMTFIK